MQVRARLKHLQVPVHVSVGAIKRYWPFGAILPIASLERRIQLHRLVIVPDIAGAPTAPKWSWNHPVPWRQNGMNLDTFVWLAGAQEDLGCRAILVHKARNQLNGYTMQ